MPWARCRRADGTVLEALRNSAPPHDPATETVVVLAVMLEGDLVAWRWDGAVGVRPATTPEVTAALAERADAALGGDGWTLAVIGVLVEEFNRNRGWHTQAPITEAQVRAAVLAKRAEAG